MAEDALPPRHAPSFSESHLHQRWHAESGFSQHKRRLGSALTARK
jgi:hypothetical protein